MTKIIKRDLTHEYQTRFKTKLIIISSKWRLTTGQNYFTLVGTNIYNELPNEFKLLDNKKFKIVIKNKYMIIINYYLKC